MYHLFIVSDGTGGTAERALNAALTQFPGVKIEIERRANVRSKKQLQKIIHEVASVKGFIVHTLVQDELRKFGLGLKIFDF